MSMGHCRTGARHPGRQFRHGGHPILRWHFDNIAIQKDHADNKLFNKEQRPATASTVQAPPWAAGRAMHGETTAPATTPSKAGMMTVYGIEIDRWPVKVIQND